MQNPLYSICDLLYRYRTNMCSKSTVTVRLYICSTLQRGLIHTFRFLSKFEDNSQKLTRQLRIDSQNINWKLKKLYPWLFCPESLSSPDFCLLQSHSSVWIQVWPSDVFWFFSELSSPNRQHRERLGKWMLFIQSAEKKEEQRIAGDYKESWLLETEGRGGVEREREMARGGEREMERVSDGEKGKREGGREHRNYLRKMQNQKKGKN